MDATKVRRNIKLFYWYMALREPFLWGPILIIYIMRLGEMTLAQIYFMEAIVVLGLIFLEVPSGALADLIGRKKTIVFGRILISCSYLWFSMINSPIDVWIANILWMSGYSMTSGADSALLYDSLKIIGEENKFAQVMGGAMSNLFLLFTFGSFATGFLAEIHLRLPIILSIPGVLGCLIAVTLLTEPEPTEKYEMKKQFNLMKLSVLFIANHKKIKWIVGFSALIGVISKLWFFSYNPYFELVNLDLKFYGVVFSVLNIIAWFFSKNSYRFTRRLGEKNSASVMVFLTAIPILIMGIWVTTLSISAILFQNVVRGLREPFFDEFLNRHTESHNRATVISIKSAFSGLLQFVFLGLFGLILNIWNLPICLQILGFSVLFLGSFGIWRYKQIFT